MMVKREDYDYHREHDVTRRAPSAPDRPGPYQVEPPSAVQPPVRPASDRLGDRDQQQAAEVLSEVAVTHGLVPPHVYGPVVTRIAAALAAARAEEAARWRAKIEALARALDDPASDPDLPEDQQRAYGWLRDRLRAVLDES